MIYFFHHYELPIIRQQVVLQQYVIRNAMRQATQNNPGQLQPQPFTARHISLTNVNPNTNEGNNNNIHNALDTFGTYFRGNVRLLNVFRTMRNVLWNGIENPNLNNENLPRIRTLNLRNNMGQINFESIELRTTFTGSDDSITNILVTNIPQNTMDEMSNNLNETTTDTVANSVSPEDTLNDAIDVPNESEVEKDQPINNDETVTETKETNSNIDEYSFEIIENKHRNEFNDPSEIVTPSQSDTSIMLGESLATPNDIDNIDVNTVVATTGTPLSQSNEKSNQTFLLEKIEIRGDDRIDDYKTDENLFTESSFEEICSSNKGDTGNCNVESRGNEIVERKEGEENFGENNSNSDGNNVGDINCDFTASPN